MPRTLNTVVMGAAAAGAVVMGTTGVAHADTVGHDGSPTSADQDGWGSSASGLDATDVSESRDLGPHSFDLPTAASTFGSEYQGRHRQPDDDMRGFSAVRDSGSRHSDDSDDPGSDSGSGGGSDEYSESGDVSMFSGPSGSAGGPTTKAAGGAGSQSATPAGAAGAAAGAGQPGLVSGLLTNVGQVVVPTLQKLGL